MTPTPLTLTFRNELDDLVAFNVDHARRSPSVRRQFLYVAGLMVLAAALVVGAGAYSSGSLNPITVAIVGLVEAVLIFLMWKYYWWNIGRSARRMFSEGRAESLVGERTLVIEDDALVERSPNGETRTRWGALGEVLRRDRYLFVYTSSVSAHVLPRSAFATKAEEDALVTELERRRDAGRAHRAAA